MSPEIRIDGKLVASVPDKNRTYLLPDGSRLRLDVSGIDAHTRKQIIVLEGPIVGGERRIGLTLEGKGNSGRTNKGGDGKEPTIDVVLHHRPIRVTYSPQYELGYIITRYNPRWIRR